MKHFACVAVLVLCCRLLSADSPPVYPNGDRPADVRLTRVVTLDDYFPFTPPSTLEAWEMRREEVRRRILLSNGLWPMPEKTDLKPIVHRRIDRGDFSVSAVILEILPGYYASGTLYVPGNLPKDKDGNVKKMPCVLCPHGHWKNGRFYRHSDDAMKKELASGAEKYDPSGKYNLQARCVTLARLGCVVFQYDMIGHSDSVQLGHNPGVRAEMNTKENWGFFSPQAELRLQNLMGLQTLTSIRILDWLETLPEVDTTRFAVTGASGGGTQSFILSAIDDRIAVEFPAVMVSTAMQGGCVCENAPYLRIGTGNVEFAALFAPKPLGMTGADDWTREMENKGLPELRKIYALYGADFNVALYPRLEFGHNYNFVSRNNMYQFMNLHLAPGHVFNRRDRTIEQPFEPLSPEELTVWSESHPKPSGNRVGNDFERTLLREMTERTQKQIEALSPVAGNRESMLKYRDVAGKGFETMLGSMPDENDIRFSGDMPVEVDGAYRIRAKFVNRRLETEVPGIVFLPHGKQPSGETVIVVSRHGKKDCFDADQRLLPEFKRYLEEGKTLVALDLLGQGELSPTGTTLQSVAELGYGKPEDFCKKYLGYTYGYNAPVLSQRVRDILTVVTVLKRNQSGRITLVGRKGAGHIAVAARAVAGEKIDLLVVDTDGFRFANIDRLDDPDLLPGAVKYHDLPGLIALSAPYKTVVLGEGNSIPPIARAAFAAMDAEGNLVSE